MKPNLLSLAVGLAMSSMVVGAFGQADAEVVAGVTITPPPAVRDPIKWPFASNSIWNQPIGNGAVYVPLNLPTVPRGDVWSPMPQMDDELIVLKPTAPPTPVYKSTVGWATGQDRCVASNTPPVVVQYVPVPSDYVVPNSRANNSATFLASDGRTLLQNQPFTRCAAGSSATAMLNFAAVDIYGDGRPGAHGGSKLSAIGGSIRIGEFRPGQQPPRHAIKINVDGPGVLHKCTVSTDCWRWPAYGADGYAMAAAPNGYGTVGPYVAPPGLKIGALLAIPASVNINNLGLETAPGKMFAWTLQNYGAYIVDTYQGGGFAFAAENGADGNFRTQFLNDWGYNFEGRVRDNVPWTRDVQRLVGALALVDNNTPMTPGGGGTPRQPLAPAITPPTP